MRIWLAVAVGLALAGCKPAAPAGGEAEREPTATVQAAAARYATLEARVEAPGNVVPLPGHVAALMPASAARLVAVKAAPGDRVERGQLLATLVPDPAVTAEARKAEIALALAARELRRQERLVAGGVAPRMAQEQAQAAYDTARADAQARQEALALARGNTALRAPFAGVVTQAAGAPGQVADVATPVFTVTDLGEVGVEADLPVGTGAGLAPGAAVEVLAGARHLAGHVRGVQGVVDPATQRVRVLLTVANRETALRPGMFVTVGLARGSHRALVVPAEAVVPRGAKSVVYVLRGEDAHEREVKTQPAPSGQIEVTAGLQAGEVVATSGAYVLADGMKVKADRAATGPAE